MKMNMFKFMHYFLICQSNNMQVSSGTKFIGFHLLLLVNYHVIFFKNYSWKLFCFIREILSWICIISFSELLFVTNCNYAFHIILQDHIPKVVDSLQDRCLCRDNKTKWPILILLNIWVDLMVWRLNVCGIDISSIVNILNHFISLLNNFSSIIIKNVQDNSGFLVWHNILESIESIESLNNILFLFAQRLDDFKLFLNFFIGILA